LDIEILLFFFTKIWAQFPASVAQAPLKSNALADEASRINAPHTTIRATLPDIDIQSPLIFSMCLDRVAVASGQQRARPPC
jgi:hypothetical protein